jgi:hypothetical protein
MFIDFFENLWLGIYKFQRRCSDFIHDFKREYFCFKDNLEKGWEEGEYFFIGWKILLISTLVITFLMSSIFFLFKVPAISPTFFLLNNAVTFGSITLVTGIVFFYRFYICFTKKKRK